MAVKHAFHLFVFLLALSVGTVSWILSVSMFLSVVSRFSKLSLATADLQRLTGAKRFARDTDLTRSLHHTLIYVTNRKLCFSNTFYITEVQPNNYRRSHSGIDGHSHTKAVLPKQTPLNNCFYFGAPNTLVHFSSLVAPKVVPGNNNNESCSNKSLIHTK